MPSFMTRYTKKLSFATSPTAYRETAFFCSVVDVGAQSVMRRTSVCTKGKTLINVAKSQSFNGFATTARASPFVVVVTAPLTFPTRLGMNSFKAHSSSRYAAYARVHPDNSYASLLVSSFQ